MKPERWQQVERLYHAALGLEAAQRAAFLKEACVDDEALRQEVESLLAYQEKVEGFVEAPALEVAAELLAGDPARSLVGRMLGHYQLVSLLGAGGMGEVYRAKDTRLGREVALKLVREDLLGDEELMARLGREARLLASLNHPNVAAIHGLEQCDGCTFLVLELVEGETLADRLKKKGMGVREAMEVCRQIAEALEAAHEKGIIHRDLKPGNVKLTPDGKVKVLDFGLAKAMKRGAATQEDVTPTGTTAATQPGMVVGTAPYMSPEQVRGEELDARVDIWAFGCVLYETLTRQRATRGETAAEILAAVLMAEPEFDRLPQGIPDGVRVLLRRCLQKDRRARLRDIGDARLELQEALEKRQPARPPAAPASKRAAAVAAAAVALALAGWVIWEWLGPKEPITKFTIDLPQGQLIPSSPVPSAPLPQAPSAANTQLARTLVSARRFLETQKYSEAAQEAERALKLAPGDQEAATILGQAQERLVKIEQGNRQARILHAAGRHQEAMDALSEVLKIAPSDPEARQLAARLDGYAQRGADEALAELKRAKSRSEEAGAPEAAQSLFDHAKRVEQQALRLYSGRQFGQASAMLFEATDLYRQVEKAARELRENARKGAESAEHRVHAESARQAYERERSRAAEADAENKAADLYREASRLAGEGQASWEQGDFQSARRGYEAALTLMQKALDTALKSSRQSQQQSLQADLEAARAATEAARRDSPSANQRAGEEEARAHDLARQGKLGEAAAAFRQAASLYHSAAQSEQRTEVQRQAILSLLKRYEAAYVNKDLPALKNIWPGLGGDRERAIKVEFEDARSIQLDLRVADIQISGDQATVMCRGNYQVLKMDGRKPQSNTRITLQLKSAGGSWTIESIRFEPGR